MFQLGTIYERRGATDPAQLEQAAKTFEMLLNKVPGDPNLCSRLGEMHNTCHTSFPLPSSCAVVRYCRSGVREDGRREHGLPLADRSTQTLPSQSQRHKVHSLP